MVGGDNASRGVAIGMVLGAYHGVEARPYAVCMPCCHVWSHVLGASHRVPARVAGVSTAQAIPQPLRDGLNAWRKCEALLDTALGTRTGKSEL